MTTQPPTSAHAGPLSGQAPPTSPRLGIAGALTRMFIRSPLTPLFLASFALGLVALVTLPPRPEAADRWDASALSRVARELRVAVSKLDDVGLTYIVGEQPEQIRVEPDPEALARAGVTLQQLAGKIEGANRSFQAGQVR